MAEQTNEVYFSDERPMKEGNIVIVINGERSEVPAEDTSL